jgi:cyclophilin family peptidyl-prolyl cis-trans isomerase
MKFKRLSLFLLTLVFIQGLLVSQASANTKPEVIFETSMGSFTLELYPDKAPKTVANFLSYVDDGFYDNTIFHRVIPDFVVQGGGFEPGMKYREPGAPVKNESSNRLKNLEGTISMARRTHPDTATSQFFINLSHNHSLDYISDLQPGYTVFGRIIKGMDVVKKIAAVETTEAGGGRNVPVDDVVMLSVRRKDSPDPAKTQQETKAPEHKEDVAEAIQTTQNTYLAGEHYVVLDRPVPTRDNSKIEVVEMFTYGCPHCYELEPLVKAWGSQQASDIDFWFFPAIWSRQMELYARAFYTANKLEVSEKIHLPLFNAIVIEQKSIRNEGDLADFFESHGVDRNIFTETFN